MTCCRQSWYTWSSIGSGLICQSFSVALAHQQLMYISSITAFFILQMECEFLVTEELILACCAPKMSWTVTRRETTFCVKGRYFNWLFFSLKRQLRSWQLLRKLRQHYSLTNKVKIEWLNFKTLHLAFSQLTCVLLQNMCHHFHGTQVTD
jgi:hypothetical protein